MFMNREKSIKLLVAFSDMSSFFVVYLLLPEVNLFDPPFFVVGWGGVGGFFVGGG